ncbi:hypothetical protein IAT38_003452 [Cryptococcus sp. DSM 104549]
MPGDAPGSGSRPSSRATSPMPHSASSVDGGTPGRGLMLPPPVPAKEQKSGVHAPPRMTRLPSLKQLSEHLHYHPSGTTPTSQQHNPFDQQPMPPLPSATGDTAPGASANGAPPSLRIATNPTALQGPQPTVGASPIIAPSPSSRLRLPASAMMRSLSAGSNGGSGGGLPTIHSSPVVGSAIGGQQQTHARSPPGHGHSPTPSASWISRNIPGLAGLGDYHSPEGGEKTPGSGGGSGGASRSGLPLSAGRGEGSPAGEGASMARGLSRDYIEGYKGVATLAEIRRRVSVSRGAQGQPHPAVAGLPGVAPAATVASAAGNEGGKKKSEEAEEKKEEEMESPPETASLASSGEAPAGKKKEHPLKHEWTLYFDAKGFKPDPKFAPKKDGDNVLAAYENTLANVGKFSTVEGFARHLNNVRLPSLLAKNSNYHLFKNGIRPMWEDPANANGGKWVVLFRSSPSTLDVAWANLSMALVGEVLDPEDMVCGIVASCRPKVDRVQVWTRGREDVDGLNKLGKRIVEAMGLEGRDAECMSMEFQYNSTDNSNPPPNKFIHIPFAARPPMGSGIPGSRSVSSASAFQGPPSHLGPSASPRHPSNLAHPLPLPPNSPSAKGGSGAPLDVPGTPGSAGGRRAVSSGNPFGGHMGGMGMGMARTGSQLGKDGGITAGGGGR